MSIYSGFGTRQQENKYNKILYHLIFLLQLKITKGYLGEEFGELKFEKIFKKLYTRLSTNDNWKYLPPKFSYALKDLALFFGIFIEGEGKSHNEFLGSNTSNSSLKTINQINSGSSANHRHGKSSVKSSYGKKYNTFNFINIILFIIERIVIHIILRQ